MKIRVVSNKDEIGKLDTNDEIIHLAFRPSNADIFMLVNRCPNVKALHIPNSYKRTISKSIKMFLEMENIEILEGDVWGHRKDLNEYSEVSQRVYDRIAECKEEGLSERDIVDKMVKETRLSADFIQFLITQK